MFVEYCLFGWYCGGFWGCTAYYLIIFRVVIDCYYLFLFWTVFSLLCWGLLRLISVVLGFTVVVAWLFYAGLDCGWLGFVLCLLTCGCCFNSVVILLGVIDVVYVGCLVDLGYVFPFSLCFPLFWICFALVGSYGVAVVCVGFGLVWLFGVCLLGCLGLVFVSIAWRLLFVLRCGWFGYCIYAFMFCLFLVCLFVWNDNCCCFGYCCWLLVVFGFAFWLLVTKVMDLIVLFDMLAFCL